MPTQHNIVTQIVYVSGQTRCDALPKSHGIDLCTESYAPTALVLMQCCIACINTVTDKEVKRAPIREFTSKISTYC